MTSAISDETLMALADGELAQADEMAVRGQIAVDPALAVRFAAFVETRMLLQRPVRATATTAEATPRRLVAAIMQHGADLRERGTDGARDDAPGMDRPGASDGDVLGAARSAREVLWRLPIAAAIAFALGGLVGYLAAPRDASRDLAAAPGILAIPAAQLAVAEALDRVPSGGERSWSDKSSGLSGRVLIVSTHRINEATACREYEISYRGPSSGSVVGASCRRNDVWRTEIAVFRSDPEAGFSPASGMSAIEQYLVDLGSPGPVSAEDEKVAIAQGWKAPR
jgi:hypothetical protein